MGEFNDFRLHIVNGLPDSPALWPAIPKWRPENFVQRWADLHHSRRIWLTYGEQWRVVTDAWDVPCGQLCLHGPNQRWSRKHLKRLALLDGWLAQIDYVVDKPSRFPLRSKGEFETGPLASQSSRLLVLFS